jgi:hypothetical protein
MKIIIHLLIVIVGAATGFALGLALRNKPAVSAAAFVAQDDGSNAARKHASRSSFTSNVRAVDGDDSPLATRLERDLSMTSGVTRWLYWLEALEKATLADYPRLAQLAHGNITLLRLLGVRWAELNPQHLFDTLIARQGSAFPVSELQRVLFAEWSRRDKNALVTALRRNDGRSAPSDWRQSFATSLFQNDVELGLQLMSEWNIRAFAPQMTGVRKWAAANPRHAAEFTLAHPADHASRVTMETIGKEWARTDPSGALEFALSKRGQFAATLADSVIKTWADRNLPEAAEWLAKTDATSRNRLSPAFVEGWAKIDAPAALEWCQVNLTGISQVSAVANVVKSVAENDLLGAASLVASMPPSRARGDAATSVMQKWLPGNTYDKPIDPEAVTWLSGLDPDSVRRVLDNMRWRWSESDPNSFAKFLASRPAEQIPEFTYSTLARSMARRDPAAALSWANGLDDHHKLRTGNEAFSEWMRFQPESARQWLSQLPPSDSRREPFFQNAVSVLAYDPRGSHQFAGFTSSEQLAARAIIEKMSLPEERRRELLNLLPSR